MSEVFPRFHAQNAIAAMERLYGFLASQKRASNVMADWALARSGLGTVADYHQVVSRLASVACQISECQDQELRGMLRSELFNLVERLQSVSPAT